MIIVNKTVGSMRIPDLGITLQHKQALKISDKIDKEKIDQSMLAPKGNLYIAQKSGNIQILQEFDPQYKTYEQRIIFDANFVDPNSRVVKTREGLLKFFSLKNDEERKEFVTNLGFIYYDSLVELRNKLISPEQVVIKKIVDEKINSFRDQKIASNFVLFDLT